MCVPPLLMGKADNFGDFPKLLNFPKHDGDNFSGVSDVIGINRKPF